MMNYELLLKSNPRSELAKRNLLDFVFYTKDGYYQANWHHILLCSYLDRFVRGEIKRLMVFMPPQHGKSELVSRNLPAFILGKNPRKKIVLASYSADLSSSFNRDCQRIIDSDKYKEVFPETRLSQRSEGNWLRNTFIFETVDYAGFLKCVGVGGSLTGTPADIAIIDDPVKDSLEAMSATYQVRNWNWYNDVLYTRIHNETGILITQTRWDQRDLSGLLLEAMNDKGGEQWTILNLPAIKEKNDNAEDPRAVGEALWPERHSKEKLLHVKAQSLRTFQSLYQQNPTPTETGAEFYKQFKIHRNVKKIPYDSTIPLHLSFDFNVNPGMHATVWQIKGKIAWQICEIRTVSPRNNTVGCCNEFKRLFPSHNEGLFVYGDCNGRHGDTRSEAGANDYSIITKHLAGYKPTLRVPFSNPSVKMRGNFINTVFETGFNGLEFYIGPDCNLTIDDYSFCKENAEGGKLKETAKDLSSGVTYQKYGHLSDANDYFMCECFKQDYIQYQNNGLPLIPGGISQITPRVARPNVG